MRYRGRIHIRVGPRKATASESEERRLLERRLLERRSTHFRTYDVTPCLDSTLDDLDLLSYLEKVRIVEKLREASLRIARAGQHYGLDRLVEQGTSPLPDTTRIVNPAWRALESQVRSTTSKLSRAQAIFAAQSLRNPDLFPAWANRRGMIMSPQAAGLAPSPPLYS